MVIAHARALLTSTPEGACTYIHADLRDPDEILAAAGKLLDFGQPAGLLLLAVMHFVQASDDPAGILRTLLDALAPGSYLVLSHLTRDHDPARVSKSMRVGHDVGIPVRSVTIEEFEEYLAGLEPLPPGPVLVSDWRRDIPGPKPVPSEINFYGAVARKP